MILEFLKGELNSKRFNEDLNNAINELGLDSNIILNGNINDDQENINLTKDIDARAEVFNNNLNAYKNMNLDLFYI